MGVPWPRLPHRAGPRSRARGGVPRRSRRRDGRPPDPGLGAPRAALRRGRTDPEGVAGRRPRGRRCARGRRRRRAGGERLESGPRASQRAGSLQRAAGLEADAALDLRGWLCAAGVEADGALDVVGRRHTHPLCSIPDGAARLAAPGNAFNALAARSTAAAEARAAAPTAPPPRPRPAPRRAPPSTAAPARLQRSATGPARALRRRA
jgi:hypothetical protein